jgi:hypothetical protein
MADNNPLQRSGVLTASTFRNFTFRHSLNGGVRPYWQRKMNEEIQARIFDLLHKAFRRQRTYREYLVKRHSGEA